MKDYNTTPVFQSAIKVGDVLALVKSHNGVIKSKDNPDHIECVGWMLKINPDFAGAYLGAYAPRVATVVGVGRDAFEGERFFDLDFHGVTVRIHPHREEILEIVA